MLNISLGASQPFNIPQVNIISLALYFNRFIWLSGVYFLEFFVYLGYYLSVGCRVGKDLHNLLVAILSF